MADAATTWQPQDLDTDEDEASEIISSATSPDDCCQRLAAWKQSAVDLAETRIEMKYQQELELLKDEYRLKAWRTVAAEFASCRNAPVKVWALYFASDLEGTMGKTQTQIAKQFEITRAALSKEVTKWRKRMDSVTHRNSRSPSAIEADRKRSLAVHLRLTSKNSLNKSTDGI
jgi:hypothetical protein